jgi:hypothetical protein
MPDITASPHLSLAKPSASPSYCHHHSYSSPSLSPDCKHKNCFLPSSVTSLQRENILQSHLYCPAGQTMSLLALFAQGSCHSLYCCQRVVTVTCRVRRNDKATRRWTSHFPSAHERARRLLCATTTAMTRADLVGTTLKGTETFVSRLPLRTTAAERFENIAQPNHFISFE